MSILTGSTEAFGWGVPIPKGILKGLKGWYAGDFGGFDPAPQVAEELVTRLAAGLLRMLRRGGLLLTSEVVLSSPPPPSMALGGRKPPPGPEERLILFDRLTDDVFVPFVPFLAPVFPFFSCPDKTNRDLFLLTSKLRILIG